MSLKTLERDVRVTQELHAFRELYHLIEKEQPDVVHLNSSKVGGSGAFIARLCGVKNIIFTAHGWPFYEDRSFVWRTLVWFFSYLTTFLSHHVIVVSQHDYRGARMPFLTKRISLIHTALPNIIFEERVNARATLFPAEVIDAHQNDIWLVSTGEHTHNKNLGALVYALWQMKQLSHTNLFLTLMSDGEERTRLEHLVRIYGLNEQVFFTGFVPEARTFLKAFDAFLLPSWKEGFPYGLLEAGAAELPVIASSVGGIPEVIEHEVTGYLINPRKPETLVGGLEFLIENPHQSSALGPTPSTPASLPPFVSKPCARIRIPFIKNKITICIKATPRCREITPQATRGLHIVA
ncbi:glycosyltransferase [Candidatus Kaiserbacteria bacterium]|nr:MAG: glycosyltransferase [Candidatus Kaiserbacteria bacterium]